MKGSVARTLAIALAAALVGALFGLYVLGPKRGKVKPPAPAVATAPAPPADLRVVIQIASAFPTAVPQLGTLATALDDRLGRLTNGAIEIKLHEPGALMPRDQVFDAIAANNLDAAWGSPSLWQDKDSAFALFGAVPFGPASTELLAWLFNGGGKELQQELYGQYGIVSIPCGMAAARAGGWFRKEVRSPDDFKGLRIRSGGLGARVLGKLGAEVQMLNGGEIFLHLQAGKIDAAEFSQPAIDQNYGFERLLKQYYFPGWQQQSLLLDLIMSQSKWSELSEQQRATIEIACGDNIRDGLAQGAAAQPPALRDFESKGVVLRRFPPKVLAALNRAWAEVAAEEAEKNPAFAKVWESYTAFRASYASWKTLHTLD